MKFNKRSSRIAVLAAVLCLSVGAVCAAAGEPASLDADTVEYDMSSGVVTANGYVLMKQGASSVAGDRAVYNTKTQEGVVEGNVIAVRDDMRVTCARIATDGQEHMLATGGVVATQLDRTFTGEQIDYYPNQNKYILVENGGVMTSNEGTFSASRLEGWMDEKHFIGTGDAHLISPPKDLEAGGDRVDYYGQENGKAVLTGNAWAIQDNNSMHSNRLTIYLAPNGETTVK